MMSIYKTSFNKIRQEFQTHEILQALERGFIKYDIDYYLIGAVAREVWMSGLNNITPKRTTTDIDFGIFVRNKEQFDNLKNYLISKENFREYKENPFVLIAANNMEIDIMPFGDIETAGKVIVNGTGMTTLYVDGLKDIFDTGLPEVNFDDKITFKVCPLHGIVLLKLIAYDDRPEVRSDDLIDIADIIDNYFSIYDTEIFEKHNDLFVEYESFDLIYISARVIGREIKKYLATNERIKQRIIDIFKIIQLGKNEKIAEIISINLKRDIDDVKNILMQISIGVKE
jgi:predicted nucleotidyltransferase